MNPPPITHHPPLILHPSSLIPHLASLILLPLILFAPLVFAGRVLYWGVPLMQFYPWQQFAAETWRIGELPLWNPLVGNGAPLAANLQTGAFYPLNALYLLLPTEFAMSATAVLHVMLAGLFMFAYARSIGLKPFAALVAAIAFQLSGFYISRLAFLSITAAFPWLAAWLWRAERAMQSGHLRDALWMAAVVGLGLLAGHAQTSLYGLILLAAYVLYRSLIARHDSERRLVSLALTGAGVLLGLGLAAIQLLPAAELARESQRIGGLDYTFAMTHSYWPWRLLTLMTPDLFGNPGYGNFWGYDNYWENAAYIGLFPLALVFLAIRAWIAHHGVGKQQNVEGSSQRAERDTPSASRNSLSSFIPSPALRAGLHPSSFPLIPFFFLTALLSLLLAFGWFTPVYPFLFRSLPGFSLFQGPARWLSVFTVALCTLAGLGAQTLLSGRGDMRRSAKWIVIGLALIGAGIASRSFLSGRTLTFPDATLRLGVLITIGGLLFGSRPSAEDRRRVAWAVAFVGIIAIDLLTAHAALNPAIDPAVYRVSSPAAAAIRADGAGGRVFMFDADDKAIRKRYGIDLPFADFGPLGPDTWLQFRDTLIPNTSMIDGIATAGNFDPLLVGRSLQLRDAINTLPLDAALRVLGLMNVRYIASPRTLNLPVVYPGEQATIYRNESAMPRVWIVPSARVVSDALSVILDPAFDPRREVILEALPEAAPVLSGPTQTSSRMTINFLQDTPNTITIRAASDSDGYLMSADTYYPGWRALLDGRPVEVLRANATFRAVEFPAGDHTVEFRYEPDSARIGALISLVTLVIVAVGLLLSPLRRVLPVPRGSAGFPSQG